MPMTDERHISEILVEALDHIDAMGSADRARLADLIGKDVYARMMDKPKTATLVERWEAASSKTKPAATKALSIAIAKTANRADLVDRIHAEIGDAFDLPEAAHSRDTAKSRATPDKAKTKPTASKGQHQKPDLAMLAKRDNLSEYMKRRQGDKA